MPHKPLLLEVKLIYYKVVILAIMVIKNRNLKCTSVAENDVTIIPRKKTL